MFAFPNVVHFFTHELACLSRRRFAFALVFSRAFQCFLFWHIKSVSPLATGLDVGDCIEPQQPLLLRRDSPQFRACKRRPSRRQTKNVAISRWAKLISADAHNSNNCPAPALTRSPANVAVQFSLGLLSKRRVRTHPVDCPNPLAAGADLTTPPPTFSRALVGSAHFSSIAQILNTIMRFFDRNVLTRHNFLHRGGETVI